jgi:hypothetical protein
MKRLTFLLILFFAFANPLNCMGECQKCKNKGNKGNLINDYPYIIDKAGRYHLESDIVLSHPDDNDAVIIIRANNVTLDMKGHTINMRNSGQTGIHVGPYQNIRLFNGRILNTGRPGPVQKSVLDADLATGSFPYQNPFANDPTKGVGIALESGLENVYIEKMTFENNFIGIAGFNNVKHVSVKNCEGIECGLKFSASKVGNSNQRGGFIIIAPTTASNDLVSENIQISQCTAYSNSAQFGIAVFHGKNVFINDCTMHIKNVNEGIGFSESSAISAISCHQVRFIHLIGHGGPNCINTYNCTDAKLVNCQSIESK